MKILVVDDEAGFRRYASRLLESWGHEVETAQTGREAIDTGLGFRPNLLVADWLLKEHLHGIHVSQALQALDGSLRTILVTGYPSQDLQADARRAGVFRLLEKPFEPDSLLRVLEEAGVSGAHKRAAEIFGVLTVEPEGRLVHRNAKARKMLGSPLEAAGLEGIFPGRAYRALDESCLRWARVRARDRNWWIRSHKTTDGNRIFLLLEDGEDPRDTRVLTSLVTGGPEAREGRWPFADHVLLVEDNQLVRKINLKQLEACGCPCCSADSGEQALKLFQADPGIKVVLLDLGARPERLTELVHKLKAVRPDVRLVGNSAQARGRDFEEVGIELFLSKPWRVYDLVELLSETS